MLRLKFESSAPIPTVPEEIDTVLEPCCLCVRGLETLAGVEVSTNRRFDDDDDAAAASWSKTYIRGGSGVDEIDERDDSDD